MKKVLLLLSVSLCIAGIFPQSVFAAGPKLSAGGIIVQALIMGVLGGIAYLIIQVVRRRRRDGADD